MDDLFVRQLSEIVQACQQKDIKPIICGGLGVYLSFCRKEDQVRQMIRATQDIDLMFCRQDLLEDAKRKAMARIITGDLKYVVQEDKKYHGFRKEPGRELDILVPRVEGLPQKYYRLTIVKSVLHGHITPEAEFIDEDLRPILLSEISENLPGNDATLYVPCLTNLMIMKLHAFCDRIEGPRQDLDQAVDHAFDMYILIMLTDIDDLKAARVFLSRHGDSEIVYEARRILKDGFSNYTQAGWQSVLQSMNFYQGLSGSEKEEKLNQASARLLRWFE